MAWKVFISLRWNTTSETHVFVAHRSTSAAIKLLLHIRSDYDFAFENPADWFSKLSDKILGL
jgi:hypothetical protein